MNFSDYSQAIRHAIQEVAVGPDRGRNISASLSEQVMRGILEGEISQVQAAVFLIALRMKRESTEEMSGILQALSAELSSTTAQLEQLVCLAEPFDGYVRNASTTAFLGPVLAACGLPAVMHGVRSVGPKHGVTTHKILAHLGIDCQQTAEQAVTQLESLGWTYIDQSVYAPKLYALQGIRDEMIKRTALTTLERVLLPIRAQGKTSLALAYVHKAYPEIYAAMAKQSGFDAMLLFKGVEGGLAPALNKPLRQFVFDGDLPEDIDAHKRVIELETSIKADVAAPSLDVSQDVIAYTANQGIDALSGTKGLARQSLSLAAGQILAAFNPGTTLSSAVEKVKACLDNGSALACLDAARQ